MGCSEIIFQHFTALEKALINHVCCKDSANHCVCVTVWRRSGCLVKAEDGSFVLVNIGSLCSISPLSVHSTPALRYNTLHILMASSLHRQDKTLLSCLVGVRCVNQMGADWKFLSSLEMQCELSLVLSWPSFQFAQMHSHYRRDWTKLFSLQYMEDYRKLSAIVANSVRTADADEMRQSCLIGVGGVN